MKNRLLIATIGFIVDLIVDYDNNRNNYKTFNDYVPVFLDKLKQKVENN